MSASIIARETRWWQPGEAQSEEEYEPHSNIRLGSRIPVPLPIPLHPAVAASLSRGRMPSLMFLAKVWPTPRSMLVTQGSGKSHDVRLHMGGVPCLALSACRSLGESEISRRWGHRRSGSARPPYACNVPSFQCRFAGGVCRENL